MSLPALRLERGGQVPQAAPAGSPAQTGALYQLVVFLLVFTGGFSVMAIEIVGGRILAPHFGGSIHVWGSLISVFMLALSFGYLLGGRLSLQRPSLPRLGNIVLLCAATALPIVWFSDAILDLIFLRFEDPRSGSLVASASLFALPTAVMGTISPYAVRLLAQDSSRSGQVAGKLYFASTAGSAAGTLLTAFFLVLWLETPEILATVVVALAACGLLAKLVPWVTGRSQGP